MKNSHPIILLLTTACLLWSCQKDDPTPTPSPPSPPTPPAEEVIPLLTQKINKFIVSSMQQYYLWNDKLPEGIDPTKEKDPLALFNKMRYQPSDPWSVLSDKAKQTTGELTNTVRSFGYELTFAQFNNSSDLFAVVLFVYPGSPAAKAGLKRGSIILSVNGSNLNTTNYDLLLSAYSSIRIRPGWLDKQTIREASYFLTLYPAETYLDPVITHSVTTIGSHKIGYLCYSDFVIKSHDRLNQVFQEFKQQQVTDIILDLRYNSGGTTATVVHLASLLAPAGVVANKSLLLQNIWNKEYGQYLQQIGSDQNNYFTSDVPVNLNGVPLYVLTSKRTASASEATIVGLRPYMQVTTVGDRTSGKYCGGFALQPAIKQNGQSIVDPELSNWILYLITNKFANADGLTDFQSGLAPEILADETLTSIITGGFCTMDDPLFAAACTRITGGVNKASRSNESLSLPYKMRPDLYGGTGIMEGRLINAQPPSMP